MSVAYFSKTQSSTVGTPAEVLDSCTECALHACTALLGILHHNILSTIFEIDISYLLSVGRYGYLRVYPPVYPRGFLLAEYARTIIDSIQHTIGIVGNTLKINTLRTARYTVRTGYRTMLYINICTDCRLYVAEHAVHGIKAHQRVTTVARQGCPRFGYSALLHGARFRIEFVGIAYEFLKY